MPGQWYQPFWNSSGKYSVDRSPFSKMGFLFAVAAISGVEFYTNT